MKHTKCATELTQARGTQSADNTRLPSVISPEHNGNFRSYPLPYFRLANPVISTPYSLYIIFALQNIVTAYYCDVISFKLHITTFQVRTVIRNRPTKRKMLSAVQTRNVKGQKATMVHESGSVLTRRDVTGLKGH
ncbi:hypothetical protein J6590_068665 [Homalodisca vitripennis]|nr:hypothetical protein J6590_068665 [Homalodisca vitripennis]